MQWCLNEFNRTVRRHLQCDNFIYKIWIYMRAHSFLKAIFFVFTLLFMMALNIGDTVSSNEENKKLEFLVKYWKHWTVFSGAVLLLIAPRLPSFLPCQYIKWIQQLLIINPGHSCFNVSHAHSISTSFKCSPPGQLCPPWIFVKRRSADTHWNHLCYRLELLGESSFDDGLRGVCCSHKHFDDLSQLCPMQSERNRRR